ncbi:glucosidase 2 subunit beta [Chlorella sorokiniana]|uniref:Glucosidase 2 subunit beta n=1 Tax=Chlorella sorokiniana TaxID=3076 RepID=A0A2P6TZG1_CHLSO|nr:glucosidase 2 subunit beta [Chlorella sorokiniana]|eukprot:PRW59454.1 glucosidase 2 subunit beta [Chlorella sorokiniana]
MGCSWRPAALLALALLLPAAIVAAPIRGLDPALAPRYQPTADGNFACLDGKKTIPFSQVNDDYCDCLDGSDEPGTSACPNGHFYCANKFFLPLLLNASMVDDGVCDCCDGSDEPAGRCPNNCYDKGMESLADLQAQVRAAEAGVAARNKYIADAVGIKAKWGERKKEVDAELETQRAEKDTAQAEKSKLEEEQKALRDQKTELEDKKAKLEQPQQGGDAAAVADGAAEGAAADAAAADAAAAEETEEERAAQEAAEVEAAVAAADAEAEAEARAAQDAADAAAAAAAEADAAAAATADGGAAGAAEGAAKSEEELAKERMAQWIPGAKDGNAGEEAAAAGEEQAPAEDADQIFREEGDSGANAAAGSGDAGAGGQPGAAGEEDWAEPAEDGSEAGAGGGAEAAEGEGEAGEQPPTTAFGKARLLVTRVVQALLHPKAAAASGALARLDADIAALDAKIAALDRKLDPVRSRENAARDKVRDLEKEQRDLTSKLEGSYGEQDVFVPLADQCFKAQVDKYTYEVCPFSKASQKEGHSSTSLGTWSGLEENGTRMAFKNGQGCWQGPARSITVTLLCGKREHLAHVAEPSRCEYTADLETPAACTPETATALQAELRKRQQLLGGAGGEGEEEAAAAAAAAAAAGADGSSRDEL